MTDIEQEFRAKGEQRGGVLLLTPADAVAMIRRCREENIRVLGLDAFIVNEKTIQPVMAESIDYGDRDDVDDRWSHAEAFVKARDGKGLSFEVVADL
ncbi:MAG: hypothetical protein AAGA21_00730 [Pseudomonadota bacterium]